jgi:type I restriction enzyme R subunit
MIASGDFVDLKGYEASMRHLIDTYIRADESEKITDFNNLTLVELIVERGVDALNSLPKSIRENKAAAAEAIENNLRRVIVDKSAANPVHFAEMSRLLDELIKQRQLEVLKYEQYLARIVELSRNLDGDNSNSYPAAINTSAKRALYDNVERDENLATSLDAAVLRSRRADWRGDNFKEKEIRSAIRGTLSAHGGASSDTDEISRLFEIIKKQKEY